MKTKIFSILIAVVFLTATGLSQNRQNDMKPPTVKARLNRINEIICKSLSLNKEQQIKVDAAYKEFFLRMDKIMRSNVYKHKIPPREKIEPLIALRDQKIKKAISGKSYVKYLELEKAARPKRQMMQRNTNK